MKRWLIPLQLDESDDSLLAYASHMAKLMCPGTISFIHIVEPERLSLGFSQFFFPASPPVDDELRMRMRLKAYQYFSSAIELNFEIHKGKASPAILALTVAQDIGLCFLPWDQGVVSSQSLARKITRKTCSSVWLVPKDAPVQLKSALLPIDFSIYSHRALDLVMRLTQRGELGTVYCQHVFFGAHYSPEHLIYTVDEAHQQVRRNQQLERDLQRYFEEELDNYISTYDRKARYCLQQIDSIDHRNESIHQRILALADSLEPDLIILGSKGLSSAKSEMLGEVTDNMIGELPNVPLLCLKRPMENRSMLNNLLAD